MGTRAVIAVHDRDESYYIYRHSEGYPEGEFGVLLDIQTALNQFTRFPDVFVAGDIAAGLVSAMKGGPGNIYLSPPYQSSADLWDIEWLYILSKRGDKALLQVCEHLGPLSYEHRGESWWRNYPPTALDKFYLLSPEEAKRPPLPPIFEPPMHLLSRD